MVLPPRIEQGSTDLQIVAMTTSAKAAINKNMKINELVGAKNHPAFKAAQEIGTEPIVGVSTYSRNEQKNLTTHLANLGWTLLGTGHYALVYGNPKYNYVLKVFSAENSDWIKYFNYIRQNQDNPFVPRIKGGLVKLSDTAYAMRMEKLTPLTGYHDPIVRRYIDPETYTRHSDVDDIFTDENRPFLLENYPQLLKLWEDIWEVAAQSKGNYDIHEENIMKRGNTLVITDPV